MKVKNLSWGGLRKIGAMAVAFIFAAPLAASLPANADDGTTLYAVNVSADGLSKSSYKAEAYGLKDFSNGRQYKYVGTTGTMGDACAVDTTGQVWTLRQDKSQQFPLKLASSKETCVESTPIYGSNYDSDPDNIVYSYSYGSIAMLARRSMSKYFMIDDTGRLSFFNPHSPEFFVTPINNDDIEFLEVGAARSGYVMSSALVLGKPRTQTNTVTYQIPQTGDPAVSFWQRTSLLGAVIICAGLAVAAASQMKRRI